MEFKYKLLAERVNSVENQIVNSIKTARLNKIYTDFFTAQVWTWETAAICNIAAIFVMGLMGFHYWYGSFAPYIREQISEPFGRNNLGWPFFYLSS